MKILMVCLGNICRSPLAQGIMQHKVNKLGLNWQIDSAGTSNEHMGEPPHILSKKVAKANGIDITEQRATQFVKEDMLRYDKILVMDSMNYEQVQQIANDYWESEKVDYLIHEKRLYKSRNIPDPWFGGEAHFEHVFFLINEACNDFLEGKNK